MFKKIAIVSFGFFILSGNFNNFQFFDSLPVDISILSMIIPGFYFVLHSLKSMSVHKSFFVIVAFFITLIPALFYIESDRQKVIMFLMIFFVLTIISPAILSNKQSIKLFVHTLLVTSLVIVLLSLFGLEENSQTYGRLTLNGGNPIWLARAVAVAGFCLIIFILHNRISLFKFSLLFAPTLFILFTTGSKGPIIAMTLSVFFIYFNHIKKFVTNKKTIINTLLLSSMAIPIIAITYLLLPNPFLRLLETSSPGATSERMILYNDALKAMANHPFGVGFGNFEQYSIMAWPHNLILEAFVELGWIPGTMLVLMILFSFIGLKRMTRNNMYGDILIGLFVMAFINSMVSGDLTSPKELYLLLPIGLNMFISMIRKPELKRNNGYVTAK